MSELNKRDLDRYITGDYGQRQFEPETGTMGKDDVCFSCGHDHSQRAVEGDELRAFTPSHSDHCDCDIEQVYVADPDDFDHESEAEARADARAEREEQERYGDD